ncbi:MAG: hypothetical protein AAGG02_20620, partial [Cyanobacteria bacterium P01_H01_bin.15]
ALSCLDPIYRELHYSTEFALASSRLAVSSFTSACSVGFKVLSSLYIPFTIAKGAPPFWTIKRNRYF